MWNSATAYVEQVGMCGSNFNSSGLTRSGICCLLTRGAVIVGRPLGTLVVQQPVDMDGGWEPDLVAEHNPAAAQHLWAAASLLCLLGLLRSQGDMVQHSVSIQTSPDCVADFGPDDGAQEP
jgi:hypothetical protein